MDQKYIKDFIIGSDIISKDDLRAAEDYSFQNNTEILDALVSLDLLTQESLSKIASAVVGIPNIDLSDKVISLDVYSLIPEPICRAHNTVAFNENDSEISVAFCEIQDMEYIEDIFKDLTIKKIRYFLSNKEQVKEKVQKYNQLLGEALFSKNSESISKIAKVDDFAFLSEKDIPQDYLKDAGNDIYTTKFIKSIFEYAVSSHVEFIFITPGKEKLLFSFRIFGRNYPIMEIDKKTSFSIISKLKKLADLSIFSKEIVQDASFSIEILDRIHEIFISFVNTDFGSSVSIEIDKNNEFKTDFINLNKTQREIFLTTRHKDSGIFIISGDDKEQKTKTLYSFLEKESKKNKEIYSIENSVMHKLSYVNQISVPEKTDVKSLLLRLISNQPEVIAIDLLKENFMPALFNFSTFGRKVYISSQKEEGDFIGSILDLNLNKGRIVKNFSVYIKNENFKKISKDAKQKYYLKTEDIKIIKSYISEKEILKIFNTELHKNSAKKSLKNIDFYTNKKNKKVILQKEDTGHENIKGVLNLGLFFEDHFLKRSRDEKIKIEFRRENKKVILENALLASHRQQIDILDILKFLKTK